MNPAQLELFFVLFLPGFAIAFLIGWFLSRHKADFLKITLWAALVGVVFGAITYANLVALFFYIMSPRVTDHFTTPLTVEQARQQNCPIPLPDSAHNVQWGFAAGGLQALEILVRFEAPVDVCRAHVKTVFDAWTKHWFERGAQGQRMNPWPPPPWMPLSSLTSKPAPEDHDMAGRATWFDVDDIAKGSTAGVVGGSGPQIWIDEDRGIFYYKLTD
jgi:hypothetical protein